MKKYHKGISLFAAIIFVFSGCNEDFIDQKPTSIVTEINFYKTVPELESGLVTAYSRLYGNTGGNIFQFMEGLWSLGNIGSDDAEKGGENATDYADLNAVSLSYQNASNYHVSSMWSACYLIIARCNQVIDQSIQTAGDAGEIAKIVNQAKFIRGIVYYHMVTLFGEIPMPLKFMAPSDLELTRSPVSEVWAQIESDLKAATNLPSRSVWKQTGRADSGAAWAMLGKVYMTQKKYPQAAEALKKVIDSGDYQLVPDFGKIHRKEGEFCSESIFEINLLNGLSGGDMGNHSGVLRHSRDQQANGWGFDCPSPNLLSEFEAGDPRIIYTFIFPGDVFPTPTGNYNVTNAKSPTTFHNRKAWIPVSERAGKGTRSWDFNYRYMRYAEVLLLYAEALNETDKPSEALIYVNMIRDRARNTPKVDPQRISCSYSLTNTGTILPPVTTTSKNDLRNAIRHEQRVELAMEGHRRYYLLRTDQFKIRMEHSKGSQGCTVEPYELLFPVPQTEIELSNKKLTQNQGY